MTEQFVERALQTCIDAQNHVEAKFDVCNQHYRDAHRVMFTCNERKTFSFPRGLSLCLRFAFLCQEISKATERTCAYHSINMKNFSVKAR